jgi:flagellar hook-basal body complex protein FliE
VTIEEANISLQLALQIRNKLLEAYQDIMRMPV